MEILSGIIALALAGLLYFKKKAEKAEAAKKLAEAKAIDQALKEQQLEVEAAIKALDAGIAKAKKEQETKEKKRKEDNLTLAQRRDRIKGKIK